MVDVLWPLAAYGAAQYVIPKGLALAAKVKLAYDVGRWMGSQAAGGGVSESPPSHNPSPQVDEFLAALSGKGGKEPKKKRKINRYNILLRDEMKKFKIKGTRGKNLPRKDKFRLASNRAMKALRKEQRDGKKKSTSKKATS